jgi:hypothetical protein
MGKAGKGRFDEIDALRGAAVLFMVFNHGINWMYTGTSYDIFRLFGSLSLGDIATPMFYLAAGFSLYFSLLNRLRKDPDPAAVRSRYTVRLCKLMFIGVLVSMSWGVLQAQAITLLALTWLTLTVSCRKKFDEARSFLPGFITIAVVIHFLFLNLTLPPLIELVVAGQFPLFAILAINSTGFYLAPHLTLKSFPLRNISLGVCLIITALVVGEKVSPLVRSGAPISFLLLGIGMSLLMLGVFHFRFAQKTFIFRWLAMTGKDALFLYVFHYAGFFVPLYFTGIMGTMTANGAIMFAVALVIAMTVTARLRRESTVSVFDLVDMVFSAVSTWLLPPSVQRPNLPVRRRLPYAEGVSRDG